MSLQEIKRQWDALGRLDPLWAMTGTHKFGSWNLEEFLATGDRQVAHLMQHAKRIERPRGRSSVLDYGCGVGRLARGFRAHFAHYLGLDISDSLIVKAREIYQDTPQASFDVNASSDLSYLAGGSFDMIFCWGVLHHIAEHAVVEQFISEFIRLLQQDGLLVFTVIHDLKPAYRVQLRRRLYAALSRLGVPETTLYQRLKLYPQQVHTISRGQVAALVSAHGAKILDVQTDPSSRSSHQFWSYYVTR